MRLRHKDLYDVDCALRIARSAWLEILGFQDTPWDYIRAACSPSHVPISQERGSRQVVINFVPHEVRGMYYYDVAEQTVEGHIDCVHLMVAPASNGQVHLTCMFNPDHFDKDGTRRFLGSLSLQLTDLTAARRTS
jgi:hypothetical protein